MTVEWQIHHAHTCPQNNVYSSFSILATAPNDVDVMNVEVSSRTIHRLSDHDKTKICGGGGWFGVKIFLFVVVWHRKDTALYYYSS